MGQNDDGKLLLEHLAKLSKSGLQAQKLQTQILAGVGFYFCAVLYSRCFLEFVTIFFSVSVYILFEGRNNKI